jgi:DNA-binding winged helix-turn-helix (wHTH) protein
LQIFYGAPYDNQLINVVLLHLPEEQRRLGPLRSLAIPRLLLVAGGTPPPSCPDTLEDWIWESAPAEDRTQRAAALEHRADLRAHPPKLDDSGQLHFRARCVTLSPTQALVAAQLIAHFDRLVERATVAQAVWPDEFSSPRALDMHISKLRRRVIDVGLDIETIRSRGWLLGAFERERSSELASRS